MVDRERPFPGSSSGPPAPRPYSKKEIPTSMHESGASPAEQTRFGSMCGFVSGETAKTYSSPTSETTRKTIARASPVPMTLKPRTFVAFPKCLSPFWKRITNDSVMDSANPDRHRSNKTAIPSLRLWSTDLMIICTLTINLCGWYLK